MLLQNKFRALPKPRNNRNNVTGLKETGNINEDFNLHSLIFNFIYL
jgi:hypothetical protein